jgi:hypothetical protein
VSKEEDVQVMADICRDNRNVARELKKPQDVDAIAAFDGCGAGRKGIPMWCLPE